MVRASFFWHGSPLSLYEKACLSSFVKNGFDVRLHSFDLGLEVPKGTTLVDARGLAKPEEIDLRTQGGIRGSLASFSNIYRYRLLSQEPGWWFDTDVFCLADSKAFLEIEERSPGISVGFEYDTQLNGAIMHVSQASFARELEAMAEVKGHVIEWGAIGPHLIQEYYQRYPDRVAALPQEVFYPVPFYDVLLLFDPDARLDCKAAAARSVCIHIHNTNRAARGIPKEIMPCAGSYLEALFISVGSESSLHARLPVDMVRLPRRIETLKEENARLRLDLETLKEENARLRLDLETLKEENARLRLDLETLKEKNARLSLDLETLKEENARLSLDLARVTGLQEKISRIYASKTWRLGSLLGTLAKFPLLLWRLVWRFAGLQKKNFRSPGFLKKIIRAFNLPETDKAVITRQYQQALGRRINFRSPTRFTEKIQWLKVYGGLEKLTNYTDKLAVRNIVRERVGEEYLVPLLAVWDKAEEIDLADLPDSFMMKSNHGSTFHSFVEGKATICREDLVRRASSWLEMNYYVFYREPQYKHIKPKILAEQDIRDGDRPIDYRFFCLNGKAEYILVNRFGADARVFSCYFSPQWESLSIRRDETEELREEIARPAKLAEMLSLAESLAAPFPFVRLDLYYSAERIYFSEYTFTPGNGIMRFIPPEFDYEFCKSLDVQAFRKAVRELTRARSRC